MGDPWLELLEDDRAPCYGALAAASEPRVGCSERAARGLSGAQIRAILQKSDVLASARLYQADVRLEADLAQMIKETKLATQHLPIMFDEFDNQNYSNTWETVIHTLETVIQRRCWSGPFYVGATTSATWRWLGGWSERDQRPMKGHCETWDCMVMIALWGDARQLETDLIKEAMQRWPDQCKNVTADSRGQCRGPNWIYVCL